MALRRRLTSGAHGASPCSTRSTFGFCAPPTASEHHEQADLIAIITLVGVAAVYVLFIRKTDEDRLRAKLRALSEAVHEDEGERPPPRGPDRARVPPPLHQGGRAPRPRTCPRAAARHDLATIAVGAARKASKIELRFSSVHVEIDRPAQRGWVMADATIVGTLRDGGGHMQSKPLATRFDMKDEWKIADIALAGAEAR